MRVDKTLHVRGIVQHSGAFCISIARRKGSKTFKAWPPRPNRLKLPFCASEGAITESDCYPTIDYRNEMGVGDVIQYLSGAGSIDTRKEHVAIESGFVT